jgi:hypothetical protein
MKIKPYKDLIKLSKEKLDEAMAPIRARQVQAKADLEMSKLEADILDKETKVQEMCIEKDINLPKLIDSLDEIALLERRKAQYEKVLKQLFPEK